MPTRPDCGLIMSMNEQIGLPLPLTNIVALPERAQRVRDLVGVARTCIIEIGRELIAAKAEIGHGNWLDWIEAEFGWGHATASNYMNVASKFPTLRNMDGLTIEATALYALAAPEVPPEARDHAIELAEQGEHVTKAEADRLIAEAMQSEQEKFEAAVGQLRAEVAERTARAVADATQRLAEDKEALEAEIQRINDAAVKPDVDILVSQLCKATGRKKLNPAQLQHLAFILGAGVTDGSRVYPPATHEQSMAAEEQLRISAP